MKIISGAQTGADRAALDFAIDHGFEHGGYCPAGRRSEDGQVPPKYSMVELPTRSYPARTERNVQESDGTLIFWRTDFKSPGSRLTAQYCRIHGKPYLILDGTSPQADAAKIKDWLATFKPTVLNVAGHRESSCPGIGKHVYEALLRSIVKTWIR